jgi:phage terminase large subunit-like protein
MLRGPWNKELIDELRLFPNGSNDDQVDGLSRAFQVLLEGAKSQGFASGGKRAI